MPAGRTWASATWSTASAAARPSSSPTPRTGRCACAARPAGSRFRVQAPDVLGPGEEARVEIWCDAPADPSFFATLRASLRLFPAGGQSLREMPLSGIVATQADDAPDAPSLRTGPLRLRRGLIRHDWHGTLEITNGGRSELVLHALELPAGVRCPAFRRGWPPAPPSG